MRIRIHASCWIVLLVTLWLTPSSWAFDRPGHATAVAPVHKEGDSVPLSLDLNGQLRLAGGGTATAANPTLSEGAAATNSYNLSGELRVDPGVLVGADQTNNLVQTSGGVVRTTQILGTGGVPSTATDATTTPQIVPTGNKTFTGRVTCSGGTCGQTQKIYGTWRNTADATKDDLICTITLNASTSDQASCSGIYQNWLYYYVVTTATSGTTPLAGVFVQF